MTTNVVSVDRKLEKPKGSLIRIIGQRGEKPTIIRNNKEVVEKTCFRQNERTAPPTCSTYTERVGPNEVLIIRQDQNEPVAKFTKTVIVKATLFILALIAGFFLLYKYCLNYSKSKETLAALLLLLSTLLVFEPEYFIPQLAINSLRCPQTECIEPFEEMPCSLAKCGTYSH